MEHKSGYETADELLPKCHRFPASKELLSGSFRSNESARHNNEIKCSGELLAQYKVVVCIRESARIRTPKSCYVNCDVLREESQLMCYIRFCNAQHKTFLLSAPKSLSPKYIPNDFLLRMSRAEVPANQLARTFN